MQHHIQLWDKEFVPFISREQLEQRVRALGQQITEEFQGQQLMLVGVLNGSFMFTSDLAKAIDLSAEVSFVKYASYEATQSTGNVKQLIGFNEHIKDKHVLIIEDIIDTGRTMKKLIEDIKQHAPASVHVATLLYKPAALIEKGIPIHYVGFEIDPRFVVGYGLDYDGLGRNIPEIYVLKGQEV